MISVILPTYNRAGYLERAMGSVLAQRCPCGELIVVDDGSTDETPALVARLAATSPIPVRSLHQENRGAAAARNIGIGAAKGDLLVFLDSDDWWLPKKLELQAAALQANPGKLIAHTREIWFRHGQRVNQKKKHDPPDGDIFLPSLAMCVVGMSTVMARRQLFERYGLFDETLPCCEDYELWLRVGAHEPFLLVPEALTAKDGGRDDQLSHVHRLGMDVFRVQALCRLLDEVELTPRQRHAALVELGRKCTIYGQGCIKHGRFDEGQRYLELARNSQPQPFPVP